LFGSPQGKDGLADLAALPPDAPLLVSVRVPELLKTRAVRQLLAGHGLGWDALAKEIFEPCGLTMGDVERITGVEVEGRPVCLVRNRRPFDPGPLAGILVKGAVEQRRRGRRYFLDEGSWRSLVFLDDRTFAVGRTDGVDRILDQFLAEKTDPPGPATRTVRALAHHVVVAGNPAASPQFRRLLGPSAPSDYREMMPLLDARSAVLTLNYDADLEAELRLDFPTQDQAAKGERALAASAGDLLALHLSLKPPPGQKDELVLAKVTTQREGRAVIGKARGTGGRDLVLESLPLHVWKEREGSATNRDDIARGLYRVGRALRAYHRDRGRLPPRAVYDDRGRPLLSWRVLLLPWLGEAELFRQFRLDDPWDSDHNRRLIPRMPAVFAAEHFERSTPVTCFCVFRGKGTAFEGRDGQSLKSFTDGLAETILVAQAPTPVPWTKPADLAVADDGSLSASWRLADGRPMDIRVVCADGTVRHVWRTERIKPKAPPDGLPEPELLGPRPVMVVEADPNDARVNPPQDLCNLRAMITRNRGDKVDLARTTCWDEASWVPPDEEPAPLPSLCGRLRGQDRVVHALAFSPDGKTIASGGDNQIVWLHDAATGRPLATLVGHEHDVHSLAFSPDGKTLVSGDYGGHLLLWDTTTRVGLGQVTVASDAACNLCFSPDGRRLSATTSGHFPKRGHILNTQTWQVEFDCRAAGEGLAFSPDSRSLASSCGYNVRLDDAGPGEMRLFDQPPNWRGDDNSHWVPVALVFATDGHSVLVAHENGEIILWETASGGVRRSNPKLPKQPAPLSPLLAMSLRLNGWIAPHAFTPDGRVLARGSHDGSVLLWDVAAGKELLSCKGHTGPVSCLRFSPNGSVLASGGEDGQVLLWDMAAVRPAEQPRAERRLSEAELETLWTDLAHNDAARAYKAILALSAAPGQSPALFAERYVSTPAKRARITRALADLDHNEFAVREKASAELGKLDEVAEPVLRQALQRPASLEVRRRLELLLEPFDEAGLTARRLRRLRAAEVLGSVGTADALSTLKMLEEHKLEETTGSK
jgi:WD40 repeat protein